MTEIITELHYFTDRVFNKMKKNITQKFKPLQILVLLLLPFSCFAQDEEAESQIITCDSVYPHKNITIRLTNFDQETDGYEGEKNSIFEIKQITNNKTKVLVKDSIFSKVQEIKFADFNNDKIKDILIQNISDVRSNWTYNLYLYDPKSNSFKKVAGFEEIKNPIYNPTYNIVQSYVVSGTDWVGFYKIVRNKVHDYKIEIENKHDRKFDSDYKKALAKISKMKI